MSVLKRAHTWEISDSENEGDEVKASSSVNLSAQDSRGSLCRSSATRTRDSSSSGAREDSVKSPGRRRTSEEIQQERERRTAAREKRREEKKRRQEEKQKRREAAERLNLLKPENLIKSLTIHIHALLLQNAGCDVLIRTLDGLVWRNRIEGQGLHSSIRWTRPALQQTEEEDEHGDVEEDQVLMVISHDEFNDAVMSHKKDTSQLAPISAVNEGTGSLGVGSPLQHLSEYLTRAAGKVLTILVIGHHQRAGSWDDISSDLYHQNRDTEEEQLLVHLQLYWNVAVYFLFGWEEVTDHVIAVTRALSKRPYKVLYGDPELGFCTDASWSGGVHVDKGGHGLAHVWTRQIQQLNRVSVHTAKAVTTTYPSPSLLLQAYEGLSSEEERYRLLADLPVGGGAKERRVGPDLSIRIRRLLTSQNPHLLLD